MGGRAAVGGGAKCSSCNMTATVGGSFNMAAKFHLPVLNDKAKVGGEPRNGSYHKMATSDWRRRQISFLPKSVMMSPFHEEQASRRRKAAAGSGECRQSLPPSDPPASPSPVLSPRTQKGPHQLTVFNNSARRSEVKANSVLLELDDLRSALRAQFTDAAVLPIEKTVGETVIDGKEKEEQLQDVVDLKGSHYQLDKEQVGLDFLEMQEGGEETREEKEDDPPPHEGREETGRDGSVLLWAEEEEWDVQEVKAALTIQR